MARLPLHVILLIVSFDTLLLSVAGCNRAGASPNDKLRGAASSPLVFTFGETGTGPGQFVEPRAIAASPDGKLFVIDKSGRVQRLDSNGNFEHQWYLPEYDKGYPSGIEVAPDGRVLVADTHYSRILVYDDNGRELFRFGSEGTGAGEFLLPTDVSIAPDGAIYVAEYGGNDRISKFNADATFEFSFGHSGSGLGAILYPSAIACDVEGGVWVVDSCKHRVVHFNEAGEYLAEHGNGLVDSTKLRYPGGVCFLGQSGAMAVADSENDRVITFDRSGRKTMIFGKSGRSVGELSKPLAICAIGELLFIADSRNARIVSIRSDPVPGDT